MKTRIKLNYAELDNILYDFNKLYNAITNVENIVKALQTTIVENNSGEAIDALSEMYRNYLSKLAKQKDNIEVSMKVLREYIEDTSMIISVRNRNADLILDSVQMRNNFEELATLVDFINQAKRDLNEDPHWYNDKHSSLFDKDTASEEADYKYNDGVLSDLSGDIDILKRNVENELQVINEVKIKVERFVELDEEFRYRVDGLNANEYNVSKATAPQVSEVLVLELLSTLTRPDKMSDEEFEIYKSKFKEDLINKLEEGWDNDAIKAYVTYVNSNSKSVGDLTTIYNNSRLVGSDVFNRMFEASSKSAEELVYFVIEDLMGGYIDDNGYLILKPYDKNGNPYMRFDPSMEPDNEFHKLFSSKVMDTLKLENTTPDGLSIYVELASPKIYQFRYYIDKQNIEYIRNYCEEYNQTGKSCAMMSDEEKLLCYSQTSGTGFKDGYDAKYHRRSFGFSMFNDKYMDSGWNSEYIVDSNGKFVSQWDVIKRDEKTGKLTVKNNAGKWINVSDAYTKDKSGNIKWNIPKSSVKEIANTESFNYAGKQSDEDEVKIKKYVEKNLKEDDIVKYNGKQYSIDIVNDKVCIITKYQNLTITYAHDAADKSANADNETVIRAAAKETYSDK